ncbi:MAG: phosphoenolpyruvate--protein phosphotransferase, partial [Thermoleophilia bacterium]|nr:phosphoenolpyruvate--protein phosphotransferase [Thermoleophilia bacterium]
MEHKVYGSGVSPGIAIGPALVLDTEGVVIPQRSVPPDQVPGEIERLGRALAETAAAARDDRERMTARLGTALGNIYAAQQSMLEDRAVRKQIEERIRAESYSAEYAVSRVIRDFVKRLEDFGQRLGDAHAVEARRRATEFIDIERQLLAALLGHPKNPFDRLTEPVVVLATDLLPSDTADFGPRSVRAFATESGGHTSHTAILAGALEIPAVVGIGRFLTDVSGGDTVIVDGEEGVLIIDPDESTIARYEERRVRLLSRPDRYEHLRDKPAVTRDSPPVSIRLLGNIELAQEAGHCLDRGAEGVGLYRTEFLYLNKTSH